jgi:hypothetical protein
VTPCSACDEPGLVVINGTAWCPEHADDGFHLTVQVMALEVGADPDTIDRLAADCLAKLPPELAHPATWIGPVAQLDLEDDGDAPA